MANSILSSNPSDAQMLRESDVVNTLDILADAVLLVDARYGRICHANKEAVRVLGYSADEFRQLSLEDLSTSSAERETSLFASVVSQLETEAEAFEWEFRHKDGQSLWMDARVKRLELGDISYLFVDLRDITARKASEEHLRIIQEALDDCGSSVLIMQRTGWATYLNAAFGVLFGYTADRMDEVRLPALFADVAEGMKAFETAAMGAQWQGEIKMISKSQRVFPAFLRATPVLGDDYDVCAILFILNDVTERIQMETQLRQSQNVKAIGQLAAGIAHEINTPVQYVGDNIRFLRDSFSALLEIAGKCDELVQGNKRSELNGDCWRAAEDLLEQTELPYLQEEIPLAFSQSLDGIGRVCEIVRAMRQFTHAGSSERKAVDLNQAIENTIVVARNEWKYVADVETRLDPQLPHVACFPGEINQVLLNLIVNAAQAIASVVAGGAKNGEPMDTKGVITISTFVDGDWVEVDVADTGSGIPEEVRDSVFDMFFTTKEVGKGTGQGLAICHTVVVEKHGGTITFDSEVGKGTVFRVRLPLRLSEDDSVLGAL